MHTKFETWDGNHRFHWDILRLMQVDPPPKMTPAAARVFYTIGITESVLARGLNWTISNNWDYNRLALNYPPHDLKELNEYRNFCRDLRTACEIGKRRGSGFGNNELIIYNHDMADELIKIVDERLIELDNIEKMIGEGIYNQYTYSGKYVPNYTVQDIEQYPVLTGKLLTHESFIELYKSTIEDYFNSLPKWTSGFINTRAKAWLARKEGRESFPDRIYASPLTPNEMKVNADSAVVGRLVRYRENEPFGVLHVTDKFDVGQFNKIPNPDESNSDEYIRENRISIKLAMKSIEQSVKQILNIRKARIRYEWYRQDGGKSAQIDDEALVAVEGLGSGTDAMSILRNFYSYQGDIVGHDNAVRLMRDLHRLILNNVNSYFLLNTGESIFYKDGHHVIRRLDERAWITNWVILPNGRVHKSNDYI